MLGGMSPLMGAKYDDTTSEDEDEEWEDVDVVSG